MAHPAVCTSLRRGASEQDARPHPGAAPARLRGRISAHLAAAGMVGLFCRPSGLKPRAGAVTPLKRPKENQVSFVAVRGV